MKPIVFLLFFTVILGRVGFSQTFDKSKLDLYLDNLEQRDKFMGSIAISQNGKLIYTKAVGYTNLANKTKADVQSKYRIGSISKTFTTVLILKAVELHKLALSQTIADYFPALPNAEKITIQHLLQHRSGIHNFTDNQDYVSWSAQHKTQQQLLDIIIKSGSDFEPGTKGEYSNSNFLLLTFILEKTFKKPYSLLLKEYITIPLGLKNTYAGGKINSGNKEAYSYSYKGGWQLEPETDMSIPLGAGAVVSTPTDITKFSDALFNGRLVSNAHLELMRTVQDGFGSGLFSVPFYDKVGFGHNGGIDGFSSTFSHFQDGDVSFALTCNGSNFPNNTIAIAILSAVYNKPYEIPDFSVYEVQAEDLDQYLGTYSSTQIPLKITITKDNNTLIAQASGQSSFPLTPSDKDKFKFEQADIILEFNPADETAILKQGGGLFNFKKE